MNRVVSFFEKQQGISNDFTYDFALRRLCVAKEDSWRGITPSTYSSDYNPEPPLFSAKFANCENYKHILAIANEDGKIALQDTTIRNTDCEEKALNAPQCHFNAVFDLEWSPGEMKFVSASGDHTARLWEVAGPDIRECRSFNGHTRSVKTAAFRKRDSSVFATGGRDGAILIWDTRANLNLDLTPRADNCIYSGHSGGPGTPVSQKKKTRTPKLGHNATSSSITGLVFQDSNTLISCGAGDGVIKVWDLRRNYTCYKKEPLPKYSLPYAGSSTFKGFTNLIIDEAGAKLYANCTDNSIYCYNLFSYSTKPLQVYHGLRNSTFFIKSCLSPDGKYLISGSSDEKAYIWNLKRSEPLVALAGHTVEVTCVAWGAYGDMPIVTCSDDARHKIWRIGPEAIDQANETLYRGHAELCQSDENRVAKSGMNTQPNLKELECTPRSLKRIVEQNEKTPSTEEKVPSKRSFADMLGESSCYENGGSEQKRQKLIESRGRRLFSPTGPCTSKLCAISEEMPTAHEPIISSIADNPEDSNQENKYNRNANDSSAATANAVLPSTSAFALAKLKLLSPLSERILSNGNASTSGATPSPPASNSAFSSVIFSPTSNLPNYVVDGDAPHLGIMSPKRKLKDKVDWLTKIRKQKLMTGRSTILSDKIQDERQANRDDSSASNPPSQCLSSPRLQSLRAVEGSSRLQNSVSRRRTSHSGTNNADHLMSPSSSSSHSNSHHPQHHTQRTPTSSRRNSETSILRFFSTQHRSSSQDQMHQMHHLQQHKEEEEEDEQQRPLSELQLQSQSLTQSQSQTATTLQQTTASCAAD
ncbi:protein lethal(2)denticleless [Eupeodes corollae]|uniref:protein lethal(2)denticleless n=1 Tax=Eupeodes corollae TaxID=290404 RepID=UPI002491E6D8|nr:protein lethal(2)denticleless [Eupeodes corollae]